jgi:hypothetical protein
MEPLAETKPPAAQTKCLNYYISLSYMAFWQSHNEFEYKIDGTLRPWAVESVNRDKKLIYERA